METDKYVTELDRLIDPISLISYLDNMFGDIIEFEEHHPDFIHVMIKNVIEELKNFGISTLRELDNLVPKDYVENLISITDEKQNYIGIVRDFMFINDISKYFEKCWNYSWLYVEYDNTKLLDLYNVPWQDIFRKNEICILL